MRRSVEQVLKMAEQAPAGPSRWPGAATRTAAGEIPFLRGTIVAVTDLSVSIETESQQPGQKFLKLLGDAYIHRCPNCKTTVPGHVTYQRSPELRIFCPWCGPPHLLLKVERGMKVRVHHRFDEKLARWAGWYAEVWEW